jgi:hypothetical protein
VEVEDYDVVVGGAGDEGAVAIGLHLDAGGSVADGDALGDLAGGGVEDDEVGTAEEGDKDVATVGGELEPVGSVDVDGEGVDYFFGGEVDDGDGAVLGVGGPKLLAVGGEVEAFVTFAYGDDGLVPVEARLASVGWAAGWWSGGAWSGARRRAAWICRWWARCWEGLEVDDADGGGAYVGGDDLLLVRGDVDHVGAVLTGAEDPVNLLCGGVVAADGFGGFGGEPRLAAGECEAVGAAEGAEVDEGERFVVDEVDDGEGVVGSAAVVGDVGGGAVGGGDDLVGVLTDGGFGDDLEGCGVDYGEGVVLLGENQERRLSVEGREGGEARRDAVRRMRVLRCMFLLRCAGCVAAVGTLEAPA